MPPVNSTPPLSGRQPRSFFARLNQLLRRVFRRDSAPREHDTLPVHLPNASHTPDHVDRLTGLPNHLRCVQMLESRAARGERFAVVALRFSNLRRISNTLERGDAEAVARVFAQRLAARPEFKDNLARVTPTEFACAIALRSGELPAAVDAGARVRRALAACASDIVLARVTVQPQLHGGVAVFPDDGGTVSDLLDHALATAAHAAQTHDPRQVLLHAAHARQTALQNFHGDSANWAAPPTRPMPLERTDVLEGAH